jgi:hypothetical protein
MFARNRSVRGKIQPPGRHAAMPAGNLGPPTIVGKAQLNADMLRFEMHFLQIGMRPEAFALTSDYPFRHSLSEIRLLEKRRGQCSTVPELAKATR